MTMNRSNIPVATSNLYINAYWDAEQTTIQQMEYKDIVDIYKSQRAFEEDAGITGFQMAPQKPEGSPYEYDSATQTYLTHYRNLTYAQGFQVTQEADEDDESLKMIDTFIPMLKDSMYATMNNVTANLLNSGFTTTTVTGEGVALFSTAHNAGRGAGVQANRPVTDADLSYTTLQDMITLIMGTKDDRGKPAPLMPKSLIVPYSLWNVATSILQTQGAPGNANNDTNVILGFGGLLSDGFKLNHYLQDQAAFYVKTDARNGLKMFNRVPIGLERVPEIVSAAGDLAVRARMRFSVGASDWRGAFASPGAAGA